MKQATQNHDCFFKSAGTCHSFSRLFKYGAYNMDIPMPENEISRLNWRKSARSINAGNCTEVASRAGAVVVRDSKDPNSLVLRYSTNTWRSFVDAARAGRFDQAG
jgi:hypothetical protein